MRQLLALTITCFLIFNCKQEEERPTTVSEHEHVTEKPNTETKTPLSPHTSAMAMIGDAHIHIDYSSPGVRNRIIFGGLLPYDEVWQAGAHMATWIETNRDLIIDGKTLPAGKYGFFTIPSKNQWTLIFNKNWNQHGKDEYTADDDVLRVKVNPEINDESTEHLTYTVEETGTNSGAITLAWEKVKINLPFKIKK